MCEMHPTSNLQDTQAESSAIELIVWRERGDLGWHARVVDGVSHAGIAAALGDDAWGAVAAAMRTYARLTGRVPRDAPVGTVERVPGGGKRGAPHETLRIARRRSSGAPSSVQSLGTSANAAPGLGNPEWMADLEYVWRMRTAGVLRRLHGRARWQRRRARDEERAAAAAWERGDRAGWGRHVQWRIARHRSAEWAEHRAQAMALPRQELVAACGERYRTVRCRCGTRDVKVGCDQTQLCMRCSKSHWRKWRKRITRAMDAHVRAARGEWHAARRRGEQRGMLPGVYLVTLTVPHSGSIAEDRDTIARGWRKLTKVAQARGWWSAYAMTYEVTPGTERDGRRGHVHVHLAAISSWIPYDELHEAWRKYTGAVVIDVSAPRSKRCESAADYLSKYVTKGVDPSEFTGQKAGELLVAMRGKRKITTSVGFWRPTKHLETLCKRCGCRHELVATPQALAKVAPWAVLKSLAERIGWWIPRGAVQKQLTIGGAYADDRVDNRASDGPERGPCPEKSGGGV